MKLRISLPGFAHGIVVNVSKEMQERLTVLDRLFEGARGQAYVTIERADWYAAHPWQDSRNWALSNGESEHPKASSECLSQPRWAVHGDGELWLAYVDKDGDEDNLKIGTFAELESLRELHEAKEAEEAARRAAQPFQHVFRHWCRRCAWALYLDWCAEMFVGDPDGEYAVKVTVRTDGSEGSETVVTAEVTRRLA